MKSKAPSYQEMAKRLEEILQQLSSGDVALEQLEERLAEAKKLLQQCQQKLSAISKNIEQAADDEN